jgi:endonuclease/exonuclease/phosphatase family metal-dependent hydrolase
MSFLQIGSWNIEHLSNRRENPQSAYALADHIEMAGIEILALQEVYVTHNEGSERRNAELDLVCELLHEHLGREWKYEVFRNRQQGDRSQLCALMWDKTRVSKSGVIEIPVPERAGGYPVWDRIPHAVKFTIDVPRPSSPSSRSA